MSKRIVREAIWMVWRLRWAAITGKALMGRPFYKMTGSGNDFVVFEIRCRILRNLGDSREIAVLCARGTGVGADGAVFLEPAGKNAVRMRYYNADGSRATLCGNASLCSAPLAVELGARLL